MGGDSRDVRVRDEVTSNVARRAEPPLPAILFDGPTFLLDLQPPPRRARLVQARLLLGDQALIIPRDHLGPRLEAIPREPSYRQHELAARDDALQSNATLAQRPPDELAPVLVQQIERHQHGRRGDRVRVWFPQPVEARTELLVVDRNLAVEHQGARGQRGDRGRDAGEASRVVEAIAADEAHARTILVRDDAPPVDLFLVDPALAVERLADVRRGHRRVRSKHGGTHCSWRVIARKPATSAAGWVCRSPSGPGAPE